MIHFFTGKPRNGKSLHMAQIIYREMKKGKNVIANFDINMDYFKKCRPGKLGKFIYVPNRDLLDNMCIKINPDYKTMTASDFERTKTGYSYIDGLYRFGLNFHKRNERGQIIEHQTLLVLDECQELFNNRQWNKSDRLEWCSFFRQHGKYGYDCYLISQDDKVIDKQIRNVLEYEHEHRCIDHYKVFGKLLGLLCGGKLFVVITRWYAVKGKDGHIRSKFFTAKRFYNFYDSYATFHGES